MSASRKARYKKRKYKKIEFKLSARQYQSLNNYCKARKTTPTKLIKKNIKRFISNFDKGVPDEFHITENQLELFE